MTTPKLTVVMAVHNGQRHLPEAVRSVLGQTFTDFILLAIDDGSTDETPCILADLACEDPRICILQQRKEGLTASLNRGLALTQSPYLARMDADDICLPERFERQVAFLDARPEVVAVGTQVLLTDEGGRPIGPLATPETHAEIDGAHASGLGGRIIHPSVMLRVDALRAIGGYRSDLVTAQDYDLWLRLAEVGQLANLPETLLQFRQHARSVSVQKRDQQARDLFTSWSDALRRRGLPQPSELPQAQREWLSASRESIEEWWISLAATHGNFRTAWIHAARLLARQPLDLHRWRVLTRVARAHLGSTRAGRALRDQFRGARSKSAQVS
jgi:glycosyltransferase involved in cell wall biosynthesis